MFERILFALVSAIALGTLCGWLTGRSVPEATAIAAGIPAIISIAGTLLFWRFLSNEDTSTGVYTVVFIVAFCTTFAWGLVRAAKIRDAEINRSVVEAMERRIEVGYECMDAVIFRNQVRARKGEPPLSFEVLCRLGQSRAFLSQVPPSEGDHQDDG